jgi:hypothetical protein
MGSDREVKALRSHASLLSQFADEFRLAGLDSAAAMHHARRAVAIVRREQDSRARIRAFAVRTFAPGDGLPADVTRGYDVNGDPWELEGGRWKTRRNNSPEHDEPAAQYLTAQALVDEYGPITEIPPGALG